MKLVVVDDEMGLLCSASKGRRLRLGEVEEAGKRPLGTGRPAPAVVVRGLGMHMDRSKIR